MDGIFRTQNRSSCKKEFDQQEILFLVNILKEAMEGVVDMMKERTEATLKIWHINLYTILHNGLKRVYIK